MSLQKQRGTSLLEVFRVKEIAILNKTIKSLNGDNPSPLLQVKRPFRN